ncbi:hypothetical protein LIER_32612 [Lithospermum erythrorhizon]|uniref:Retroviral polymerase SH3-like domain-containing protein n=1 Tax=Lithospermum erythrorhizon TaxID=34254 RepID=A0AAV3RWK3_LITER
MTSNESIFKDIDKSVKSQVCLGNEELVEVTWKRMISCPDSERSRTSTYSRLRTTTKRPIRKKNRIIMEMARSMLEDKNMPKKFWAEAVYTTVYLLNRHPTQAVQEKTHIEVWSGHKPLSKHLRVFGCRYYAHVPAIKRTKVEEKTEKGIFLGYSS